MGVNADDPLLAAAARIGDGLPVDWRRVQAVLANSELETVAHELESIEHLARVSGAPPPSWGRFSIVEELGRGVFGTVYRAVDSTLQIEVALKILRPRPGVPFNYERALEEARRLARVSHPAVVRVYAAERIGDEVGLSMELVEGKTLDAIVRQQGTFSASEASLIGMDLCRALAAVHGAGLLHGDIKAHNVMRANGGRTMLMDFGAGRELRQEPTAPGSDFAGTPVYLAPEVFAGASRTAASEIYSLGVLLYFLVTGSYPVEGNTRSEIGRSHDQHGSRRPLRDARPDLPGGFIRVVERALAYDPRQRFESAGSLEAALAAPAIPIAPAAPGPAKPPGTINLPRLLRIAAAIVLILGLAGVLGVMYWDSPGSGTGGTAPRTAAATPAPAPAAPPADEYRIDASFYKVRDGSEVPLEPGGLVRPGDQLSFQLQVSVQTYVYIVNEDDEGASFLMFPLPGQSVANPLSPGRRHRIPGNSEGKLLSWQVSTAGRREHFLLFASRERSPEFENIVSMLPLPILNRPVATAAPLSAEAINLVRGVGRLAVSPLPPGGEANASRRLNQLPDFMPFVPGEEKVRGIWRRRATFDNPRDGEAESRQPKK